MPDRLTPAQIRGARGMLGWSMLDLATAARVSVSTVKRIEDDLPRPASDGIRALIRAALEQAGIVLLADDGTGPGIRYRPVDAVAETREGSVDIRPGDHSTMRPRSASSRF